MKNRVFLFRSLIVLGLAVIGVDQVRADVDLLPFWREFFARPAIDTRQPAAVEAARVELGRRLFQDVRLSGAATRSCASCHRPERSFTDGQPRAEGLDGERLPRNTPSLWNVGSAPRLHWDGAVTRLEEQARLPIEHERELAGSWPEIVRKLEGDPEISALAATAFAEADDGATSDGHGAMARRTAAENVSETSLLAIEGTFSQVTNATREGAPTSGVPSPRLRGEGQSLPRTRSGDEGPKLAPAQSPAPHPNPLPARGERGRETIQPLLQDMSAVPPNTVVGATRVTPKDIVAALAAYERTFVSPPTRFDRWIEGEKSALTAREQAGFRLFTGKAGCVGCHARWRFTDDETYDIGLPGEAACSFKTPSLRESRWSAPYMHDGSVPSLEAAIQHYESGIAQRAEVSSKVARKLSLTAEERRDLLAFLRTLSSDSRPAAP